MMYRVNMFDSFRFLRVDTLSLLLSMGNVGAHSDVLVVDMVGGILTGAVAERLGGQLFCLFTTIYHSLLAPLGLMCLSQYLYLTATLSPCYRVLLFYLFIFISSFILIF